jgi:hypothetical protein
MRLSEWRATAPFEMCMSDQVLATLAPALHNLGAEQDPECLVVWGDSPNAYYSIMVPTPAGLAIVVVRLKGPDDGPRAAGKLIRWSKLQVGEFSVESFAGHRLVSAQVDAYALKGTDTEADRICEFVRGLVASADGRIVQPVVAATGPAAAMAPAAMAPAAMAQAAPPKTVAAKAASPKGGGAKTSPAPAQGAAPAAGAAAGSPKKGAKAAAAAPPVPPDKTGWIAPRPIGAPPAATAPTGAPPAGPTTPPAPGSPAGQPARPLAPYAPDRGMWDVPEPAPEPDEPRRPRWTP